MKRLQFVFFTLVAIAASATSAEAICAAVPPNVMLRDGSLIVTGTVREIVVRERKEFGPEDFANVLSSERPVKGFSDDFWPIVMGENAARLEVQDSWKGPVTEGAVWLSYRVSRLSPYVSFNVGDLVTVVAHGSAKSGYKVHPCYKRNGPPAEDFRKVLETYRSRISGFNRRLNGDGGDMAVLRQLFQFLYEHRDFERAYDIATRMSALDPGNPSYQSMAARALLEFDPEDRSFAETALATFERILDESPQQADASRGQTLALIRLDREHEIDPAARDFSFLHVPTRDESGTDLSGRDLAGAIFRRARVRLLGLSGAKLAGANFGGARIWQSSFRGADLTGANFEPSSEPLEGGQAGDPRTDLFFVTFEGADLRNANFSRTSMRRVFFDGAHLSGANFSHTAMAGQDLSNIDFGTANFDGTDLSRANLEGADLSWARVSATTLTDARYDCATRWPDGFDPVAAGAVLTEEAC